LAEDVDVDEGFYCLVVVGRLGEDLLAGICGLVQVTHIFE
jgi:hypothetical protein